MKKLERQPVPLDENGLPLEWRLSEPIYQAHVRNTEPAWLRFEQWCIQNNVKPIPATAESVLRYLKELPSPERRSAYMAVSFKHESIYWHTDACPHCILKLVYGFQVRPNGQMTVRQAQEEKFKKRFGPEWTAPD